MSPRQHKPLRKSKSSSDLEGFRVLTLNHPDQASIPPLDEWDPEPPSEHRSIYAAGLRGHMEHAARVLVMIIPEGSYQLAVQPPRDSHKVGRSDEPGALRKPLVDQLSWSGDKMRHAQSTE